MVLPTSTTSLKNISGLANCWSSLVLDLIYDDEKDTRSPFLEERKYGVAGRYRHRRQQRSMTMFLNSYVIHFLLDGL